MEARKQRLGIVPFKNWAKYQALLEDLGNLPLPSRRNPVRLIPVILIQWPVFHQSRKLRPRLRFLPYSLSH